MLKWTILLTCILEDKEPCVGGLDGKISVAMGYAALESLSKGIFVKVDKVREI